MLILFRGRAPGSRGRHGRLMKLCLPLSFPPSLSADDARFVGVTPALRQYMRTVHAPLLRRPGVKAAVLAAFLGVFLLSCAQLPRLEK